MTVEALKKNSMARTKGSGYKMKRGNAPIFKKGNIMGSMLHQNEDTDPTLSGGMLPEVKVEDKEDKFSTKDLTKEEMQSQGYSANNLTNIRGTKPTWLVNETTGRKELVTTTQNKVVQDRYNSAVSDMRKWNLASEEERQNMMPPLATNIGDLEHALRQQNFEDRTNAFADESTANLPLGERYKLYMNKTYGHSDNRLNE